MLSEQYGEQFAEWSAQGSIEDAFRAHLLGIGVLPAGLDEWRFLHGRIEADLAQLLGVVEHSVADARPEPESAPVPETQPEPAAPALTRDELVTVARQSAADAGIDPDIFERQIQWESGFDPSVTSPAGAEGIAQIVRKYHPGVDPMDPKAALVYAAQLMRSHLDRFGSYDLALAAYNAGAGAVEQYGGVPPYDETQRYVRGILG